MEGLPHLARAVVTALDWTVGRATLRYVASVSDVEESTPLASHLYPWQVRVGDLVAVAVFDPLVVGARVVLGVISPRRSAPGCLATGPQQSIPNATLTPLVLNGTRWDGDGLFSNGVLRASTAGLWLVGALVAFPVVLPATGRRVVALRRSGNVVFGVSDSNALVSGFTQNLMVQKLVWLAAGEQVEALVLQDSGGPLDVLSLNERSPEVWLQWLER
ncbi:MAG: hypothetical protein K6U89_13505 [Chloroflexi bacterium]|nr:hypothetical protein [Chloroflexota bacterium]